MEASGGIFECPTCGKDDFQSDWGMRSHHKQVHGDDVVSDAEALEHLRDVAEDLGHPPRVKDMSHEGRLGVSLYKGRFGSWNQALKEAELGVNVPKNITRDDLLDELRRLIGELGHPPSQAEMREYGKYDPTTYGRYFGSWSDALAVLGHTPKGVYSKQELFSELQRLSEELGRTPTVYDMESVGNYSQSAYTERFGSWTTTLKRAGFEPNLKEAITVECSNCGAELKRTQWRIDNGEHFCDNACRFEKWQGTGHPCYNGGTKHIDYGEGWNEEKKELVRERDSRRCQNPGCGRTEAEHIEEFDRKHPVHHIVPANQFDDPEKRNAPSNLITLCCDGCHQKWERMSPLRPDPGEKS